MQGSAPGRSRTCDLSLRRRLLYPLSYWGSMRVRPIILGAVTCSADMAEAPRGYRDAVTLLQRLRSLITGEPAGPRRTEDDVPVDTAHAGSRATGGGSEADTMDRNSTTGTTESEEFVGRAGGDETGDVGLSGSEARAGRAADGSPLEDD